MSASEIAASLSQIFALVIPEAVLGLCACVLFVGATFKSSRHLWAIVALVGLIVAGLTIPLTPTVEARREALSEREKSAGSDETQRRALEADSRALDALVATSPIVPTRLALLIKVIALVSGVVLLLFSWYEVPENLTGEYSACLLLTVAGLSLTAAANELVTLFLALELISIPSYILLYLPRSDTAAQEASVKYFLLSIFSSALLLFGFSYLYGLSGSTNLETLMEELRHIPRYPNDPYAIPALGLVALVMVVAGLCFKITAVPFHFYAPDVYQGAPTPAVALLAFVPKAAGFVALIRLLYPFWMMGDVAPGLAVSRQVPILLWILAAMTMSVGNVLALLQDNVKRMLAYSSVANAGYMLIGLAVALDLNLGRRGSVVGGVESVLFYLVAYGAMTIGAFAVLSYLSTPQRPVETVDDLAGLSRSHPGVALLMALFLFSLIGMPLTAGFAGKFLLFMGALAVDPAHERAVLFRWLALIGVINAAIAAWYYLRVIAAMYLRDAFKPLEKTRTWPGLAALWICAALTLGLGIYPWPLVEASRAATRVEK